MKVTIENDVYKVSWKHIRDEEIINKFKGSWGMNLSTKMNGVTKCVVIKNDNQDDRYDGFAFCSEQDQYNKDTGRKVSMTFAIETLPKEIRKEFWKQYFKEITSMPQQEPEIPLKEKITTVATMALGFIMFLFVWIIT